VSLDFASVAVSAIGHLSCDDCWHSDCWRRSPRFRRFRRASQQLTDDHMHNPRHEKPPCAQASNRRSDRICPLGAYRVRPLWWGPAHGPKPL